jgi:hypothetical protein
LRVAAGGKAKRPTLPPTKLELRGLIERCGAPVVRK